MLIAILAAFAADPGHAALHSAASDLYFEVPDVRALVVAYERAPLVRTVCGEPAAKLAEVTKSLGWDLAAIAGSIVPVADAARPDEPLWPWSSAVRASLSLRGLDAGPATGATPTAFGALAVVDFVDVASAEQAQRALRTMLATGDAASPELAIGESRLPTERIALVYGRSSEPGWLARQDARLLIGLGSEAPESLAARSADPGTNLARAWTASDPVQVFSPASGATVVEILADTETPSLFGDDGPTSFFTRSALLTLVPFACAKGRWRIQLRDDRFVTEGVYEPRGPAREWTARVGARALSARSSELVPSDAIGAWTTSVEPDWMLRTVESQLAAITGAEQVALPAAPEGAPRLSDGLGEAIAICLMPLQGMPPTPGFLAAIELKDAARFQAGLEAWLERTQAAMPDLKVARKPYRKLPLVTLSLGAGAEDANQPETRAVGLGALDGLEPTRLTIAPLADRVLFASAPNFARDEIKRLQDKQPRAHAIAAQPGRPADAFEASTFDWGGLIGKLYDLARGFAPMLAQNTGRPIDLDALPTSAELLGAVRPSWSWSRHVEGRILSRSESSFGPETPIALALVAVVGARAGSADVTRTGASQPAAQSGDESAPVRADDAAAKAGDSTGKQQSTQRALRDARTAIAVYKSQFARAPAALDDLLKPTDAFPDGFLPGGRVPLDGWGRALVYEPSVDGSTYGLRSSGPDGVDDQGAGDDVRSP